MSSPTHKVQLELPLGINGLIPVMQLSTVNCQLLWWHLRLQQAAAGPEQSIEYDWQTVDDERAGRS